MMKFCSYTPTSIISDEILFLVHIDNDIIFSDYVEFFSAPQAATLDAAVVPMTMRCHYTGTYLLRVFNADGSERSASSSTTLQQQSNLGTASSASARARSSAQGFSTRPTVDHQHYHLLEQLPH